MAGRPARLNRPAGTPEAALEGQPRHPCRRLAAGGGRYDLRFDALQRPTYRTVAVTTGDVRETDRHHRHRRPGHPGHVNFAVAGTVTGVKAAVGQVVKAGTVLATLSPFHPPSRRSQAESNLESAQSKLASDQLDTNLTTAQGSVSSAQNSLSQDEISVTDTQASNASVLSQAEQAVTQAQARCPVTDPGGPDPGQAGSS